MHILSTRLFKCLLVYTKLVKVKKCVKEQFKIIFVSMMHNNFKCTDVACERESHMHRNHTCTGCALVHRTRKLTGFTGINLRPGWRLPEGDPDAGSRRDVYRKQNYTGACYRYTYLRSTLHTLRSGMFPLLV